MKKNRVITFLGLIMLVVLIVVNDGFAQYNFKNAGIYEFQKKELNWGLHYNADSEREETLTDEWRTYEKLNTGSLKLNFNTRFWNYLDYKQENVEFNIEAGPLWGNGNWIDSSVVANIQADHRIKGLRTFASASYSSRFYYNHKNYTLVQLRGWGRYDLYSQNSTGFSTDSDQVVDNFEEKVTKDKFRFNVSARAGWGIGRLKPMNHFMVADYLLKKYYSNTNFSQDEITRLANEIGRVKNRRSLSAGHKTDAETAEVQQYLNQKMFQVPVASFEEEWKTGEFMPRYDGTRVEFGPFFNYYNREPDFIYGGYFLFSHSKYCNVHWNRDFSAGINYNAYKRQDWVLAEISMAWSYFMKLKSKLDFGVKYIPGIDLDYSDFKDAFNNGFIPHIGYFTQLDSKNRIDIKLAYRISGDDKLMLSGPEFSVSVYRSRY